MGALLWVRKTEKGQAPLSWPQRVNNCFNHCGVVTWRRDQLLTSSTVAFKYLGLLKTVSSPTCVNTDIKPNSIYLA